MNEPQETLSRQEERVEEIRKRAGFLLAPVVFVVIWFIPLEGMKPDAHRLLAILGVVITLWISEAIPLAIAALLGPTLCVLMGIGSAREVFSSFADPIIFLFIGSFLLAEAIFHHGLNRRIAFQILGLKAVGDSPAKLMLAFGCISCFFSMWISNTTTTAMMYPVGISILSEMARRYSIQTGRTVKFTELKFGIGLMLMAAFASAVGGFATPVGAAPNLIGIGMIRQSTGAEVHFFKWVCFGLPLALILLVFLVFYLTRMCPGEAKLMEGNSIWIQSERAKLGELKLGEKNVLMVFAITVLLWLLPGVLALTVGMGSPAYETINSRLPEPIVALLAAILLFVLPVDWANKEFTLSWNEAKRIDWGTILLFGGGMALGDLMFSTGLARWLGDALVHWTGATTELGLTILFTLIAGILTQVTSNTAAASMCVPVAIAVAQAAGVNPIQPAIAACLAAGLGCMLPVSTPPCAIVYGSGCIPITQMIKHGFVLTLVGMVVSVALVMWVVPLLF